MEKNKIISIIAAIAMLFSMAVTFAAPAQAEVSAGSPESYSYTPSATSVDIIGGNVTEVNVSTVQVTDKWVGFYGQVSGSIVLGDSSGNKFYQWTISDPTGGVVYATNNTVSDWTSLQPLYADSGYLPSILLDGTDSFNNTFTSQETFTSPSTTINNVNYTTTWQGGAEGSTFKTYALYADSGATLVWAGNVQADQTSFNSGTADYQILAGVNQIGATQTFYFYLELP